MLQREDGSVWVVKLFRAKSLDVGHAVDVMTERAEAWIRDEVKGEKSGKEEGQENRDANDEQDTLTKRVPLAKCDVRYKYDGRRQTK